MAAEKLQKRKKFEFIIWKNEFKLSNWVTISEYITDLIQIK